MNTSEAAVAYCQHGWSPVPIPLRSKNPGFNGWERTRLKADDVPTHFTDQPQNIGILLGEPSGWLIDVDLDHPLCVALADEFLPPTPAVFGRPNKLRSHRIYRVSAPVATKKHKSKSAGMLVELRSTGTQTVFPPSTHESGELITWEDQDAGPAMVDPVELLAAVERLADAVKMEIGEKPAHKPSKATKEKLPSRLDRQAARITERIRIHLLVERVDYDGTSDGTSGGTSGGHSGGTSGGGTVSVTFRPNGIKTLAQQNEEVAA